MKRIFIIAIIAAGLSSCTGEFEEINTNPNTVTVGDISPYGMFEPILYDGANNWLYYTWRWNDELIQYTANVGEGTNNFHRYVISSSDWQTVWNLYSRYANNAVHMYNLAVEKNEPVMQAIALTYKALYLSNLSDIFGDIPYAEAFTGRKADGTKTPKFDSQKEVYQQLFADLEAANDIYATNPAFRTEKKTMDGMYGGQTISWRRFNNSLYLRLLCRVSGRAEMNVGAKMTQMLNNPSKYPIFTSNEDNATVNFSGLDPYRSYFEKQSVSNASFTASSRRISEQVIKMTVHLNPATGVQDYWDPRLSIYGKVNLTHGWVGAISGCTELERSQQARSNQTANLNYEVFARATAPAWIMDYAEVQFILAEAALKGWIPGGESEAKRYFEKGVTASMEKWAPQGDFSLIPRTISLVDIQTYLASEFASWDNATIPKEELIANQKYLALFWVGMEGWHEYRRTGYPLLTIGKGTDANNFILPTRFAYPPITMASNAINAQAALDRMGGANNMKTPIWWSKQAISGK